MRRGLDLFLAARHLESSTSLSTSSAAAVSSFSAFTHSVSALFASTTPTTSASTPPSSAANSPATKDTGHRQPHQRPMPAATAAQRLYVQSLACYLYAGAFARHDSVDGDVAQSNAAYLLRRHLVPAVAASSPSPSSPYSTSSGGTLLLPDFNVLNIVRLIYSFFFVVSLIT